MSPASSHTQESARHFIEVKWVPLHRVGHEARTVGLSLPFSAPQGRIRYFPGNMGVFLQFPGSPGISATFRSSRGIPANFRTFLHFYHSRRHSYNFPGQRDKHVPYQGRGEGASSPSPKGGSPLQVFRKNRQKSPLSSWPLRPIYRGLRDRRRWLVRAGPGEGGPRAGDPGAGGPRAWALALVARMRGAPARVALSMVSRARGVPAPVAPRMRGRKWPARGWPVRPPRRGCLRVRTAPAGVAARGPPPLGPYTLKRVGLGSSPAI
ncbi:hypothetical protein Taro_028578 [Colocasia esculenta]|uniref:Uncharacterized protein n=1 Tax=Colocasia esculenta TaxID=4460 RepID=A0A843VIZ2_COLES|nr:hypothetical protein [Colocasia esculenta]